MAESDDWRRRSPADTTLHGASMGAPAVRTVTHLHGGHVPANVDGHPEAWFSPGKTVTGPQFQTNAYEYPNNQTAPFITRQTRSPPSRNCRFRWSRSSFYTGPAVAPAPNELYWKDTVRSDPGTVTRILVPFADYTGDYVWHCHIVEHEDYEMMRPMNVTP